MNLGLIYPEATLPLGDVPIEKRRELWRAVWVTSLFLGSVAAGTAALTGYVVAPKKKGRVAGYTALGAGLATFGAFAILGWRGIRNLDSEYDRLMSAGKDT